MLKKGKQDIYKVVGIVLLIICAMICRDLSMYSYTSGFLHTIFSVLRSGIYISLIIAWGISVKHRVINIATRRYLLMVAILLFFWFTVRTCKYMFLDGLDMAKCMCWYSFYIPMICIPLAAVFIAFCLGEGERDAVPEPAKLMIIPSVAMISVVLTNNIHQLVFEFNNGIPSSDGEYSYGPMYIAVVVWICIEVAMFFVVLIKKSQAPHDGKRVMLLLLPIVFAAIYTAGYIADIPVIFEYVGDMTVVFSLVMMATFEMGIRTGLIPSNSYYEELLQVATIGIQIVDEDYNVCYLADNVEEIDKDIMRRTEKGPVDIGKRRLCGAKIRGGHVIWEENIEEIQKLISELNATGKKLSENNELLKAEFELRRKQIRTDEQMRLYDKVTGEVAPQLEMLKKILNSDGDTEIMRKKLAHACVISSYIKRRGNLVLLGEESESLKAKELEYCLKESVDNLSICGPSCMFESECRGSLMKTTAVAVYDFIEEIIEKSLPTLTAFMLKLYIENGNIEVKLSLSCDAKVFEKKLLTCSGQDADVCTQDSDVYISLRMSEGRED